MDNKSNDNKRERKKVNNNRKQRFLIITINNESDECWNRSSVSNRTFPPSGYHASLLTATVSNVLNSVRILINTPFQALHLTLTPSFETTTSHKNEEKK
jgi:hypothetical protein